MKKRINIISILVGVLLIISAAVNGIMIFKFNQSTKTLHDLQAGLINYQNYINPAYENLHSVKSSLDNETQQTSELKAALSAKLEELEVAENQSIDVNPIYDGNTVLDSGLTLDFALDAINSMKKELDRDGVPFEEQRKTLEGFAETLGTTLETIESYELTKPKDEPVVTPSPVTPTPNNGGGNTSGGNTGGSVDEGPNDFPESSFTDEEAAGFTTTSQDNPFSSN